jgi:hypothetical protein
VDWVQQNPGVATALIAALAAIAGGIVAAAARFLFDTYLSEQLRRRWQAVETIRRYASPIIHAVDDLAGRIDNLNLFLPKGLASDWLRPLNDADVSAIPFDRYYYMSTLFAFIRMIAWIEILRREQIFLDFSSTKETRSFNAHVSLIYAALTSPGFTSGNQERHHKDHWIYFHYLSGIAEIVITRNENGTLRCMTFQEFCIEYQKGSEIFRSWAQEVERLFVGLEQKSGDLRWQRIQILWYCLDSFLDFIDPKKLRTTRLRTRSRAIDDGLKNIAVKRAIQLGLELGT